MSDDECLIRLAQAVEAARFRASGRGGKADRTARGDDRIDRILRSGAVREESSASRLRLAQSALRFGEACTKDDAVLKLLPARQRPHHFQGPPMSGFATARQKMVDGQVRPSDVTDIRILDAMLAVPREAFVPQESARAGLSGPRSRCQRRGIGEALPDQAGGHGEDAAGRRDQGHRQGFGGGLRDRVYGRAWLPGWRGR